MWTMRSLSFQIFPSSEGLQTFLPDGWERKASLADPVREMEAFAEKSRAWLCDYCLYGNRDSLEGISWNQWPEDLKTRKPEALAKAERS